MQTRIILSGTAIAAVALCWAICGGTAKVDTVPTPAAESAVSALCAPQMQPVKPSSNIVITEPVTQPETVPVAGSVTSPEQECPQTTPTAVPVSTPAEKPAAELPATISKPAPTEEPTAEPSVEEEPPAQGGMVYVPGFGYLKNEGPSEWSVSESMCENGNKVGIMG